MNLNATPLRLKKVSISFFLSMVTLILCHVATAQNTASGTVYNDVDGSARGTFSNIKTGTETGTNGNGTLNVYVVTLLNIIVAKAVVAPDGTYTSTPFSVLLPTVYLVLDTVSRDINEDISDFFYSSKLTAMPAGWANTSPYMTHDILTLGGSLTNRNFGIQKNGFLTLPDFSICGSSDSLFTWYFRGDHTNLITGNTIVENSGTSEKVPFLKVTARYFTNNDTYSTLPDIYEPATYTIADNGGWQPVPNTFQYPNPVLEMSGSSLLNGVNNDSMGVSVAFKNTNGQKLFIQKINNAVLDLDTYESLKVTGYNNGTPVKPVIYTSNGYGDNNTNDMRSFYMGNTAWIFGVSSGFQAVAEPCNAWCDYNYNSFAVMEFPTPVDSIFYTARITEPTGNRGYNTGYMGSNEITGFNYCPVNIQGILWNDANGNGIIDGVESNILNSGFYINMVDEYGKILATAPIQADGTYTFSKVPQLASTTAMKLQLSGTEGIIGSTPPATSVPNGYISISENQGGATPEINASANKEINLPLLLGSNLISYNFGIEQLPVANAITQSVSYPTGGVISVGTINKDVSGNDPEDGGLTNSNTIVFTALPANAVVYYGVTAISLNQTVTNFNPALLSYTGITNGSTSVVFQYAFFDAANKQGPSANYTVNWLIALPVKLERFAGTVKDCNEVTLNWKVSDAINFDRFEIERRNTNVDFRKVGSIIYNDVTTEYTFTETVFEKGIYQYRLKLIDVDGKINYSPVVNITINCNEQKISVYPNPTRDKILITNLTGDEQVSVYNNQGQRIYLNTNSGNQLIITLKDLPNGIYTVIIRNKSGEKITETKIAKVE